MRQFLLRPDFDHDMVLKRGREVIAMEKDALSLLADSLDDQFVAACQAIVDTQRQLAVTGMGKSGHIGRKVAATFAATGTPAIYIHPAEAAHGDLGMLSEGDTLIVFSNSGNTAELTAVLKFARKVGIRIIGIASRRKSNVLDMADVPLLLPSVREACAINVAPTTSTALQLALGDALAMTVMDMRGISKSRLRALHPAGSIGLALMTVREFMHAGDRLPLVSASAGMPDAISIMTSGCFGVVGVTDDGGRLIGIITDGDLRRHFEILQTATAGEVMTPGSKLLEADIIANDALAFLTDNKISAAFVVEDAADDHVPIGIIQIHDLLRFGMH